MKYLVVGGAGFVGSHVAIGLLDSGHKVAILDNLSTGHLSAIPKEADFYKVDLLDFSAVNTVLAKEKWDAVLHFAALSAVGDSIKSPVHYLRYNTQTSFNLIESCVKYGIKRFVFSSTAALFGGDERSDPIAESSKIDPGSPYGESKFFIERALVWADRIYGMKSACLRYFNAAGSDSQGRLGEDHRPETHLIPLIIDTALGRRPEIKLFGNDYATRDGTCVRDYIHVTDLADAHIKVIDQLETQSVTYNLGNGQGFTNLEVLHAVERICGRKIPWSWAPRRLGDPAILIADSSQIRKELNWDPKYSDLDTIVKTALYWRENHPEGYE